MRPIVLLFAFLLLAAGCTAPKDSGGTTTSPSTSTSQPAPATPTGTSPAQGSFKFTEVVTGLENTVYVTHAGDGSGRLFVVEQVGRIRIVKDGVLFAAPFLDIRSLVASGGERGLLSVAFHPQYETNGMFIVDYTRSGSGADVGDTVIARYKVSAVDSHIADPASAEVLLVIDQPQGNHNGGLVTFGPDGMLYVGSGDGGNAADVGPGHAPEGNGQNLETHLGKILRIDVTAPGPYKVPSDNPNLGSTAKKEIWAYGMRNPWRFSFDRATGDLYVGDVGQNAWEEIDHQPKASKGGENYGWPVWEGTHLHRPGTALVGDTKPVAEYSITGDHCSVTGGYVYRGTKIPALQGFYVVGDYCTGHLWTLVKLNDAWSLAPLMDTSYSISSFGEDESGELYLVNHGGAVYRFDPA